MGGKSAFVAFLGEPWPLLENVDLNAKSNDVGYAVYLVCAYGSDSE